MARLVIKPGANIQGVKLEMRQVLMAAGKVWDMMNCPEVVVTSGMDGAHALSSFHYYGYALDFRSWQWADATAKQAAAALQKALGEMFFVRYEPTLTNKEGKVIRGAHIHAHYKVIDAEE